MANTITQSPTSTNVQTDSGSTSTLQTDAAAMAAAVSASAPSGSYSLAGLTWTPIGPAGSPASGLLTVQWKLTGT